MDIKKELEEVQRKQQDAIKQMTELDKQKQQLLQEVLRLDGEGRLLARLKKEEEDKKGK